MSVSLVETIVPQCPLKHAFTIDFSGDQKVLGNKNVVSLILVATLLVTLLPFSMVTYA